MAEQLKNNENLKTLILAQYLNWKAATQSLDKLEVAESQLIAKQEQVWKALGVTDLATAEEDLLTTKGKFIDKVLEGDYQKYLARKTSQGKIPRERLDWKEAMDYWLNDSSIARGNAFNKTAVDKIGINTMRLR